MIQENFNYENEQSSENLRRQITATRHRMSETIQEIGEELKPKQLMENYFDEYAEVLVEDIKKKSKRFSKNAARTIKANPLPVLAIIAGIALVASKYNRSKHTQPTAHARTAGSSR